MFNDIIKRQSQGLARIAVLSVAVVFLLSGCSDGPQYIPPVTKPLPPVEIPDGYVWTEIPELPEKDDPALVANGGHLQVITHLATFHSGSVSFESRNYSMLYDREQKVSHWVAYPMHRVFINGGGSRANNYLYDPAVPSAWQSSAADREEGGYGGYGRNPYQRGHQIAAADRNSSQAANDQTFYMTNMTPQNGNLNGGEWAGLETWVRDRAKESGRQDTLYVVSGCWLGGNPDHIANRNEVAIPEAYYKVLLRTASGKRAFPSDDDCELVGFWVENRAPGTGYEEWTMGVAEIERRTGFDFFPSISNGAQNAADDPSQWNGL